MVDLFHPEQSGCILCADFWGHVIWQEIVQYFVERSAATHNSRQQTSANERADQRVLHEKNSFYR
jgi:hypothetical protein